MFLREGTQARATSIAVFSATLAGMMLLASPLAAENGARGVELPHEVLPWRRAIESQADELLADARRTLRTGDKRNAERMLRELARAFPGTHAAGEGERELAKLARPGLTVGRRGLGIAPRGNLNMRTEFSTLNPVAGWETTVKPDAENFREAFIEAAGDRVFFKQGSTKLDARARATLKNQARWLKSQPKLKVRIAGHADDIGSTTTNMRLSHDRAVAVRRQLIRYGVPANRLRVFSHGKSKPIAICTIQTCAAQNRRVVTEIRSSQRFSALD